MTQEALAGALVVRAYGREEVEIERFRGVNREYLDRSRAVIQLQALFYPSMALLLGLAGRHQELLSGRGIYYKLYQLQYRDQEVARLQSHPPLSGKLAPRRQPNLHLKCSYPVGQGSTCPFRRSLSSGSFVMIPILANGGFLTNPRTPAKRPRALGEIVKSSS